MEQGISPASEELRRSVTTTLADHRQRVYDSNYNDLKNVVSEYLREDAAGSDPDELLWIVYEEYFVGDGGKFVPEGFEGLVSNIEELVSPEIAEQIVPDGTIPPLSPADCERAIRNLEIKVTAASAPGKEVLLPNEYRVLMSMVGAVYPCGLPKQLMSSESLYCLVELHAVQVPRLPELSAKLHLGQAFGDWVVYAGFITGPHAYADEACCGFALCEQRPDNESSGRRKAWRIVYANRGDDTGDVYDSLEEFLEWYG